MFVVERAFIFVVERAFLFLNARLFLCLNVRLFIVERAFTLLLGARFFVFVLLNARLCFC